MNKCIFFALITSKRPDHGRSDLLRLILSFTSLLKFKIARDISYIHTVESTQILFVAKEMLFYGEIAILRTLCRTCGARARVRINVQMDCHSRSACTRSSANAQVSWLSLLRSLPVASYPHHPVLLRLPAKYYVMKQVSRSRRRR